MIKYKLASARSGWAVWCVPQQGANVALAISCLAKQFPQYDFRYSVGLRLAVGR